MLEQIFLKVLDMSRTAGMIIVIVCIARILLKRFPKCISYMLWSAVLFRLLCPATLELGISLVPSLEPVLYEYASEKEEAPMGETPAEQAGKAAVADTGSGAKESQGNAEEQERQEQPEKPGFGQAVPREPLPEGGARAEEPSWQELFLLYGKYVWISGAGIMFLYFAISAARIRSRVAASIPLKEEIYIVDGRMSPFVMGIIRPRIYLPEGLGVKEQEYIVLHERLHIRRLDHIVRPVAFAALCAHWFNPLVWAAFVLSGRDMEMSCDEAVVRRLGEGIRADYSASLLALSTQRPAVRGIPVDFGEGNTKGRIRNLASFRKTKKGVLAALAAGAAILIVCLATTHKTLLPDAGGSETRTEVATNGGMSDGHEADRPEQAGIGADVPESDGSDGLESDAPGPDRPKPGKPNEPEAPEPLNVSLNIREYYATHKGDPHNLFYIDGDNVLWGSGWNEYGQLGQGTQGYEFHAEMVKIAEGAVHVDYSQKGFAIFLTENHKLYGMGNAGCGALQQYEEFDWGRYTNGDHYTVTEPILLMEDVIYACCGRTDVVCLTTDGTVWTWGTVYFEGGWLSPDVCFYQKPQKILEDVVLVTGGWFNHAALRRDGTVWTWGYNMSGNCGVENLAPIGEPMMVAEDVAMVWTDLEVGYDLEPGAEAAAMAWVGKLKYNMEYDNIAEFEGVFPRRFNNTVIQKSDGSYWVCGEDVGTEEKSVRGQEGYYTAICTHEFQPCR